MKAKLYTHDDNFSIETEALERPLSHHISGVSFTATGYGKKIPTRFVVLYKNRWRRVYCAVFGNSGSAYIEDKDKTIFVEVSQ